MAFFCKRKKKLLGVDIDSTSLSMLELIHEGEKLRLNACAHELLFQGGLKLKEDEEGEIPDFVLQGQHIEKMIKKGKFTAKQAVTAVPVSSVITRKLSVDASMTDDEIENQIALDAEKLIPYPIDEVAMDFEVIDKEATENEKADVLLVACRKQVVDDRESLLSLAGLHPYAVDVVTYAMERAYRLIQSQIKVSSTKSPVALVHMSDQLTTLNIMQGDMSIYTGSSPFGTLQIIEKICHQTQCSIREAAHNLAEEKLSNDCDQKLIDEFVNNSALQINRLLEQFYSSGQILMVDRIVLSGGIYHIDSVKEKLQKLTDVDCMAANPFLEMEVSENIDSTRLQKLAPAFFVACGLAMREIL